MYFSVRTLKRFLVYLVLIVTLGLILFPILWMISTAFKTTSEAVAMPPHWIPSKPTLEHFIKLWTEGKRDFLIFTKNSLIVASCTSVIALTFSTLTGYGLSRIRFRGSQVLLLGILSTQMFPLSLILIPLYMLYRNIGLLNTYVGLILAFTTFGLPFGTWMMKGFFDTVPLELEEAALIDGAGPFRVLFRIAVPLVAPGLVTVAFYSFLQAWNNLLFALTLTSRMKMRPIPPGFLQLYVGQYQYYWADMLAGSTAVTIPIVLIFIVLQRWVVKGLAKGALKG